MKKKIVALLIAASMACAPAAVYAAEDTDARIAALEERVTALEELISMLTGPGVSATPQQESEEPAPIGESGIGMEAGGCTFTYTGFELVDNKGKQNILIHYDFVNNSGETVRAMYAFNTTVFQHGREVSTVGYIPEDIIPDSYQIFEDRQIEIRSGTEAIPVAFAFELSDLSDIIVNLSSSRDWDVEPIEFTISLE